MDMVEVKVLYADGRVEEHPFPAVYDGTNKEAGDFLRKVIGGWLEFVWVEYEGKRTCMIVHEEGALIPLPINAAASLIYHIYPARRDGVPIWMAPMLYPPIHGDVVLLTGVTVL